ncbi:MAG TPA: XrtA system polysaccharide chain length determinant [Burkholderiales bacterium]|nr:XrtA system polysaccharide chain length determinant [Burkholderiales bacterium]
MHELAQQFLVHLKAMWRYRWFAVAFAWLVAICGWVALYLMPDHYEADARIYVDTQSVLRPLLSGLAVQPNLDQMVAMMGRTLISRTNLEKVVQMAGLDQRQKTEAERVELINRLTTSIVLRGTGKENLYTISYMDTDPKVAKQVVQSLLTLFVEGNSIDKRKDSDSAQHFIDEQLAGYRENLVKLENSITDFKRKHIGLMPSQGSNYFVRLDETKTALNKAVLDLREAENARDSIKKRLDNEAQAPASLSDDPSATPIIKPESEIDTRIHALEQKLDGLRTIYTDQHPDIVATRRIIDQLKEQRTAEAKQAEADNRDNKNTPQKLAKAAKDPVYQQLMISLSTAEANVAGMKARVAEYTQRYSELQAVASAAPQVEAEYTQLTRDYDVTKTRYDELLRRRDSARISGEVEASEAAMSFRVIDPPQVPLTPTAPNRRLLMTWVLLAALGAGLGAAFVMSQVRPTVDDERRLRELTGMRVLGTVVMAWTDSQKSRRVRELVALVISVGSLLSAYAALMAMLMLTSRT